MIDNSNLQERLQSLSLYKQGGNNISKTTYKMQQIQTNYYTPKIENVVGTFTLDTRENLKLKDIAYRWSGSRYNKARFSGLIARNQSPKVTYMIFSNGKVIITGARSGNQCQLSCSKLIKKISKFGLLKGLKPKVQFKIHNVVATVNTRFAINLQTMRNKLTKSRFDPQNFPGLIYKMNEPKATFLVFSTGKVVMTGVQSQNHVSHCFKLFYKILKKFQINKSNRTIRQS